jgi:ATP-dependent Clp protease ATP-binding subunit ClpB
MVQQRILTTSAGKPLILHVTRSAKEFLLTEGIDFRYGARPLKRAIERLLVQPLSNLIATGQIRRDDCIRASHSEVSLCLTFFREAESSEVWEVASGAAA